MGIGLIVKIIPESGLVGMFGERYLPGRGFQRSEEGLLFGGIEVDAGEASVGRPDLVLACFQLVQVHYRRIKMSRSMMAVLPVKIGIAEIGYPGQQTSQHR